MKKRVLVGLSGGVDSAVAAARLIDAGYDVEAFFMWLEADAPETAAALEDSRQVAAALGIAPEKHHVWDLSAEFERGVIAPFVGAYGKGLTPNPCVRCNRVFKFGSVVERALREGFDFVATGHYARIERDSPQEVRLRRGASFEKDQSYVLAGARAEMLAHALFPLWDVVSKGDTRAEATRRGLPVAAKRDSFDICFIHDGDTRGFLRGRLGEEPGPILDESGAVVGEHLGAFLYTVGQRRGLHLPRPHADGEPRYVTGIDVESNTVRVGPLADLSVDTIQCGKANWLVAPEFGRSLLTDSTRDSRELTVQFRAHGRPLPASFEVDSEDCLTVRFDPEVSSEIRGVAAGQSLVVYRGDWVIAQAEIRAAS